MWGRGPALYKHNYYYKTNTLYTFCVLKTSGKFSNMISLVNIGDNSCAICTVYFLQAIHFLRKPYINTVTLFLEIHLYWKALWENQ
jgi:hypothetical protein